MKIEVNKIKVEITPWELVVLIGLLKMFLIG